MLKYVCNYGIIVRTAHYLKEEYWTKLCSSIIRGHLLAKDPWLNKANHTVISLMLCYVLILFLFSPFFC